MQIRNRASAPVACRLVPPHSARYTRPTSARRAHLSGGTFQPSQGTAGRTPAPRTITRDSQAPARHVPHHRHLCPPAEPTAAEEEAGPANWIDDRPSDRKREEAPKLTAHPAPANNGRRAGIVTTTASAAASRPPNRNRPRGRRTREGILRLDDAAARRVLMPPRPIPRRYRQRRQVFRTW